MRKVLGKGESDGARRPFRLVDADRDVVALGIAIAGIVMFVGTGSAVLPEVLRAAQGLGMGPDKALVNALLLNIALIIFGWRRYSQLLGEIDDRRKAEERARQLADTDQLTGCLNRRSLREATQGLIATLDPAAQLVGVMMIDLDNFKQVNDFHGHAAGDEILVETARRIRATAPADALVARLGGDEFACAFAFDCRRAEIMDAVAARMIEAIAQPVMLNGARLQVTVSVGLARSDMRNSQGQPSTSAAALLHMADNAMYHAKKQGRHQHVWFEPPMEDEHRFRCGIEAGIRKGIPAGEFIPFYEQQVDLQTGELTGFEVLARWNSPQFGLVKPDIFIPVAEEIGAISVLSESVISQALDDARHWDPRLSLSVNISPVQLRDPWFAQKLLKLLVAANFPPERLEIEITESCLHENLGLVRSLMASLKNQGIRVSLDDFGTGYSSLAQLRTLPFDRIKIDRTFVSSLGDDQDAETVVQAIALLGKGLGLPVTAEGIESGAILAKLREYGEIKGQGYLYGLPQPAEEVRRELARREMLVDPAVRPAQPEAAALRTGTA